MRRAFPYIGMLAVFIGGGAWIALYGWEMFAGEPKYVRIEPDLYIGGFLLTPPGRANAILNVCEQDDPYRADFKTEVYLHAPVNDAALDPGMPWLKKCVEWLIDRHNEGSTTYVHCLNGGNRSTTVVAAYLMSEHGIAPKEALTMIQARWPQMQMPTRTFNELLDRWHAVRSGKPDPGPKLDKPVEKEPAKETPIAPVKKEDTAKNASKEPDAKETEKEKPKEQIPAKEIAPEPHLEVIPMPRKVDN